MIMKNSNYLLRDKLRFAFEDKEVVEILKNIFPNLVICDIPQAMNYLRDTLAIPNPTTTELYKNFNVKLKKQNKHLILHYIREIVEEQQIRDNTSLDEHTSQYIKPKPINPKNQNDANEPQDEEELEDIDNYAEANEEPDGGDEFDAEGNLVRRGQIGNNVRVEQNVDNKNSKNNNNNNNNNNHNNNNDDEEEEENSNEDDDIETARREKRLVEKKYYMTNRPIVDINSSRLCSKGYSKYVLICNVESADADRNRQNTSHIQNFNDNLGIIRNWDETALQFNEIQTLHYNSLQDMASAMKNNNPNSRMPKDKRKEKYVELCEKEGDSMKNAIVVLTDILYYIPESDLYNIFEQFNDGTVAVGSLHIPKYTVINNEGFLESGTKYIQFDQFIEGEQYIIPNNPNLNSEVYPVQDCRFVMHSYGNDHYYTSPIALYQLQEQRELILQPNIEQNVDFILKVVRTDSIDCNATNYISFKILKITQPKNTDFITQATLKDVTSLQTNFNTPLEYNKQNINTVIYTAVTTYRATTRLPLKIVNINHPIYKQKQEKLNNAIKNTAPPGEETNEFQTILKQTSTHDVTLIAPKQGWPVNSYYTTRISTSDMKNLYEKCKFDVEIYNKVATRILTAPAITKELILSLITLMNKEMPNLKTTQLTTILAHILVENVQAEKNIFLLDRLNAKTIANLYKKNELTAIPHSFLFAMAQNKLITYLKYKIRCFLDLTNTHPTPLVKSDF